MKLENRLFEISPDYYEECDEKGKVERIDYKTTNYDGNPMDKYAFVYTPYGYDPEKKYEILYLIHGGKEYAEKYLYQGGEENPLKRAVDNMIKNGEIEPLIIVTPSEYPYHKITENGVPSKPFTSYFHNELVEDLLPAVESKYSVIGGRDHRSVMGWSMGCATTWYVFLNRIAEFSRFGFLSGACSNIDRTNTKEWADASAKDIIDHVKAQGFTKKDYTALSITGTLDIAFEGDSLQQAALLAYPEYFDFHGEEKNAAFLTWPEGEHHTKWRLQYTINAIKQFFKK